MYVHFKTLVQNVVHLPIQPLEMPMKGEPTHLFEVTMSYRSNVEAVLDEDELRSQLRRMVRSISYWQLGPHV